MKLIEIHSPLPLLRVDNKVTTAKRGIMTKRLSKSTSATHDTIVIDNDVLDTPAEKRHKSTDQEMQAGVDERLSCLKCHSGDDLFLSAICSNDHIMCFKCAKEAYVPPITKALSIPCEHKGKGVVVDNHIRNCCLPTSVPCPACNEDIKLKRGVPMSTLHFIYNYMTNECPRQNCRARIYGETSLDPEAGSGNGHVCRSVYVKCPFCEHMNAPGYDIGIHITDFVDHCRTSHSKTKKEITYLTFNATELFNLPTRAQHRMTHSDESTLETIARDMSKLRLLGRKNDPLCYNCGVITEESSRSIFPGMPVLQTLLENRGNPLSFVSGIVFTPGKPFMSRHEKIAYMTFFVKPRVTLLHAGAAPLHENFLKTMMVCCLDVKVRDEQRFEAKWDKREDMIGELTHTRYGSIFIAPFANHNSGQPTGLDKSVFYNIDFKSDGKFMKIPVNLSDDQLKMSDEQILDSLTLIAETGPPVDVHYSLSIQFRLMKS